jgi:HSP20 family protein
MGYITANQTNTIYPGEYVPMLKEAEVHSELKRPHERDANLPPVNVTESADSFEVEFAIPGMKREEFMIFADEHILSVCVVHKEPISKQGKNFQLHEFNYECFERNIPLPENVDAEFVSAEYASGILRLHMNKAQSPPKNLHTRIVVY